MTETPGEMVVATKRIFVPEARDQIEGIIRLVNEVWSQPIPFAYDTFIDTDVEEGEEPYFDSDHFAEFVESVWEWCLVERDIRLNPSEQVNNLLKVADALIIEQETDVWP